MEYIKKGPVITSLPSFYSLSKRANGNGPGKNLPVSSSDTTWLCPCGSAAMAPAMWIYASPTSHCIHAVLLLSCDAPVEADPLDAAHEDGVSLSPQLLL